MPRRALAVATALLLATGACSNAPQEATASSSPPAAAPIDPTAPPTPTPTNPAPRPQIADNLPPIDTIDPGDRLVVQTEEGQLLTVRPDGSNEILLTDPEQPVFHGLPVWSPDASHLAWSSFDRRTGRASLRSSRFDRTDPHETTLAGPPVYLAWDPSSTRVGYLAPGSTGFRFGHVDVARQQPAVDIDEGSPYFFSWSPDGDEALVHASRFRLDRVSLDGTTVIIEDLPASFQAPMWVDATRALIFADQVDGVDSLVTTGVQGEGRLALATYDGYLTFVLNPDANRIALQVSELPTTGTGIITTATRPTRQPDDEPAPFDDPGTGVDPVDEVPIDTLAVFAVYGGVPVVVSDEPARSFFWAPGGDVLAFVVDAPDAGRSWLEWRFWDGVDVFTGPRFLPSAAMDSNYLPFFDQHDQAVSYFSPDGASLVFAGTVESGERGIFVVDIAPGATPTKVGDGVFAAWSPLAAGSAGTTAP